MTADDKDADAQDPEQQPAGGTTPPRSTGVTHPGGAGRRRAPDDPKHR
jgi:hypothetical protein